ncbi:MAG TPA: hypothetical protein VIX73_21225, partial [Kofleriaceae bacterium]
LSQLDAIGDSRSWFYEVRALRGDILLARGTRLRDGGDRDRAERDFAASRAAYAAAAAIGRSVPSIYKSLGDLEHAALRMAFYGQGDVMAAANRAFAAIDQALTAVPDHYDTLVLEAYVRRSVAEHLTEHGGDVGDLLPKALAAAQRAVKAAPARSDARLEMAQTYRQWGDFRMNRHEDPSAQLREAIAISDAIPPTDRDATYYGNLGLAYSVWGDYQADNHGDAAANYDKAIDAFGKAVQYAEARRSGQLGAIYNNLGITLFKRASQRQGKDSDGDLRGAIAAFDNARRLIPGHPAPCLAQGQALEIIAQHARARGDDPGPDLERALAAYRAGLATNPSFSLLYNGVGSVLQARASVAWEHGEQPEPLLDDAQHAFEQAIEAAPDQSYGYDNVGEVLLQRAGYQRARDEDPRPSVAAAVKRLDEAIKRDPNYSTFSADLGMAHAIAAAYELEHGIDPVASLELARKAIRAAIKKNGSDPQAQLYTAEILGLQARLDARHGRGKSDDFRAAADAFHKALGLAPDNQDYPIAFAQFCRAWAAFERDPGEMLDSGLEAVNQVLTPRPAIPDALVVRASLALMRAQREADGAARRTHAASAADDFARALRGNPALERVWAAEAAQAQRLAAP